MNKITKKEVTELAEISKKLPKYRLLDENQSFKPCAFIIKRHEILNIPPQQILVFKPNIFTLIKTGGIKYTGFLWSDPRDYVVKNWQKYKNTPHVFTQLLDSYMENVKVSGELYQKFFNDFGEIIEKTKNQEYEQLKSIPTNY